MGGFELSGLAGVGSGVGEGLDFCVGVGDGAGVGFGEGEGVGDPGDGLGLGLGDGLGEGVVSITSALLPARESLPASAGRVRVALLPAASWMVPPLRAREEVAL